jgi:transcriptional regulator GlxA family with amidase domain
MFLHSRESEVSAMAKKKVVFLLFDDMELLDFAGPCEVFSVANELGGWSLFEIETASATGARIRTVHGIVIQPDGALPGVHDTDILVIPGGRGTREVLKDSETIAWVQAMAERAELVLSVCTGSMVLAKAGLLDGLKATTHHTVFDEFEAMAPNTRLLRGARFVDNGKVITSAGISTGIDMSLHIIERLFGRVTADAVAAYMEYLREVQ